MATPAGLEPATLGFEGRCSIQLSYGASPRFIQRRGGNGEPALAGQKTPIEIGQRARPGAARAARPIGGFAKRIAVR